MRMIVADGPVFASTMIRNSSRDHSERVSFSFGDRVRESLLSNEGRSDMEPVFRVIRMELLSQDTTVNKMCRKIKH